MVFPLQPSDSLILVSWPCPEGHFPIFSAIQAYLSRTFHLAVEGHENAQHNRDIAANTMTPDRTAETQRLAHEWMAKHQ